MIGRSRILYVDAAAGASGDMILGALVDLGVPLRKLKEALLGLPFDGWNLRARWVLRGHLRARKVDVRVGGENARPRDFRAIRRILREGQLQAPVRERAEAIFRRLVEAEAEAHGSPIERVHLHEAGAIDAIVDVVGACVGLSHLGPDRIVVSRLTTGSGTIDCAHGRYPVPGPATSLLIRGVPVTGGDAEGERLTPTGAAILTTIADGWGTLPEMHPLRIGSGAGDRDFHDRPNVLRMILGEAAGTGACVEPEEGPGVVVMEFTVDDATPQALAYATERLLAEGALEVYTTAVTMKKGRSGHHLTVIARDADRQRLTRVILTETSTLGVRHRHEARIEMDRALRSVRTPYGAVRVKVALEDGRALKAWPEYEDCAALARRRGVPLVEVQAAALRLLRSAPPPKRLPRKEKR